MSNSILGFSEDRVLEALHDIEHVLDYFVSEIIPKEKKNEYDLRYECSHELNSFVDDFCQQYEHSDMDLPGKISMVIGFLFNLVEKNEETKERIKELDAEKKAKRDEDEATRKKIFEEELTSIKAKYAQSVNTIRQRYSHDLADRSRAKLHLLDMYITSASDVDRFVDLWIHAQYHFCYYEFETEKIFKEIARCYETKQMILEQVYQLFSCLSARINEDDDDDADSLLMNHVMGEDDETDNS